MRWSRRAVVALLFVVPAAPLACGSRTGLLLPLESGDAEGPDGEPLPDGVAPEDAFPPPFDATAPPDAPEDAGFEAAPPIDAHFGDASSACPDAGSTLVYVLTAQNELYSFYPPTLAFTFIGAIECPGGSAPFSMGVNREGLAFSVFEDGNLYRLDTKTAACAATTFAPGQHGFETFGMGFAADGDGGETLYVAQDTASPARPDSTGLAEIDTTTFTLGYVAAFSPPIPGPELSGTADGRLFGFFTRPGTGSDIVEFDRTTGQVVADNPLTVGSPDDAFAFAFWGGEFWVFTAPGGPSTVTRYDPATRTEANVATLPATIVGAGVSTCAPQ